MLNAPESAALVAVQGCRPSQDCPTCHGVRNVKPYAALPPAIECRPPSPESESASMRLPLVCIYAYLCECPVRRAYPFRHSKSVYSWFAAGPAVRSRGAVCETKPSDPAPPVVGYLTQPATGAWCVVSHATGKKGNDVLGVHRRQGNKKRVDVAGNPSSAVRVDYNHAFGSV